MPIYEKPTKVLMHEFARSQLKPGQEFDRALAVKWFAQHYPRIKPATVQMHVEGMSINAPLREHHPTIRPGSGHDLFYKAGRGRYRLWDSESDPPPFYPSGTRRPSAEDRAVEIAEEIEASADELSSEFGAEADLQNYLRKNVGALGPGLTLYEEEGFTGVEFPAGGRRIDILCRDADGGFVVVELKVSRGYDRVIGQILRYMAWVKQNLADGKPVRGIIVASNISDDLKLATSLVSDISLIEYELSFKLKAVS